VTDDFERCTDVSPTAHSVPVRELRHCPSDIAMRRVAFIPLRRPRARRAPLVLAMVAAVALLPTVSSAPAAVVTGPRFGLFTMGTDATIEAASAGLREGFRLSGLAPQVLERSLASGDATARAVLNEFALEGVDVVFVLGPDAACLARDTLREPSVVFAAVGYPEALGLPGRGNVCGVAGGVAADEIVAWARSVAPTLRTLGVVAGSGAESRTLGVAIEAAAGKRGLVIARAPPDTAATLGAACEAIWLPPGVTDAQAESIARALEGGGTPLLGSRRGHLDAGCSAVLRRSPRDQGLRAAALGVRVLRGEAPQHIAVVRPRRLLREVSLNAARRLGHAVPLSVIAAADHLVPALGQRR